MSKDLETNRIGDLTEHRAITWLLEQGWEVFRNTGRTGPVDMVGIDQKGNTVLLDIKTHRPDTSPQAGHMRSDLQKEWGVCILEYNPADETFKFVRHKDGSGYRHRDESKTQLDLAFSA